ncbi:hypothetical protein MKW98_028791 [Papaver atlanticum]|uniref:Magnesium-transporting ATPase, P-type 1 n=1 Tax=Papaver atlanticum TaxID=357466 RepID=A0AAD4XA95_9MAGN|nr:hypothetical protein MKW98_028791 [Papaver atlanticum]
MDTTKFPASCFGLNGHRHPSSLNHMNETLVKKHGSFTLKRRFIDSIFGFFIKRLYSPKKIDGGKQTEEEGKVCSWLYALAQSGPNLVFEYVRSTERGLSFKEAERRLAETGPNVPLSHSFPSWMQLLWNAFFHPFNIILIVLAILSFTSSDYPNGIIMLVLVFVSVALRFYQEYNSSKAAMKLVELLKCPVKVQRCAGSVIQTELTVQIDQRDIVPGDIVIFGPGDLFPGDVRLITSKDLIVSQSSLTGESGTTKKTANIREDRTTPLLDLRNICFMGTSVVSGSGTALVVSTGAKTYMSTMFSTIGKHKPPDAFEKSVRNISYALIAVMLVVVPIIVLTDYYVSRNLSRAILFGVSFAVALTPQMLPLIVNINLAKGALAMARDRCIVKSLTAIQNMGAMDILCIDKTGTLTVDQLIMVHHLDSSGLPKERVLRFAFLNSYFKTELRNPVDEAILAHVYSNGYRFEQSKCKKIDEIPFDFTRRRVSVIIEADSETKDRSYPHFSTDKIVVTKGALEEVLQVCSFCDHADSGSTITLSVEDQYKILHMGEELSNDGLRVLGVATRRLTTESTDTGLVNREKMESNMVFLGILTFFDPPKSSAKQALWRLAEKGVEAKVLTGDSLSLAIRVCKEVGIRTTYASTGPDLELLDPSTFHETVQRATVLARLTPTQKLRVVQSLQTAGDHVVGFLGDGVNDSLAMDAADVGISVDSGVSVAKDLADIILLEKDLNVLVSGVERGRITYGNTMKYIKLSVVANVGSVVSLLIAVVLLGYEPLTARQLVVQNFLYNVGQIAIPWDTVEEDYAKFPQRWSSKSIPTFMLWNGPVCSMFDLGCLVFLGCYYEIYHPSSGDKLYHTCWFVEGLLMQTLIIHMIRTEKIPFIQEVASWPVICSTVLISAVGIALPYTPIGKVMGMTDLPLSYFGFLVLLFLGYFFLSQVVKRVYIRTYKEWL